MADTENTAEAGEATENTDAESRSFQAIESQEDLDRIIQSRLARERKQFESKIANLPDLEAKAARLAEIEEANKTEAEKAAEKLAAAEKRAAELEAKATRAEVAAAKGVPAALLTGSTQEELEASADALIEFRGEQKQAPSSSALNRVNGAKASGSTADQFAAFMGGQLS